MNVLRVEDLRKAYVGPDGEHTAIVDVPHFAIEQGHQVALRGSSGSGKTTFLNLIAGILQADSGIIEIGGDVLHGLSESARDRLRADHIGYVFQTFNLLQGYTALENVELGMMFGPGVDAAYARALLERVGLSDRMHYRPRQLSVGQQQRVAVARALANRPRIVLADEPTGNLDRHHAQGALRLIRDICQENGAALLLVSHDREVLEAFEDSRDFHTINRAAAPAPEARGMKGLFLIVRRSLRQHALSTGVTIMATALAAGLVMAVFAIQEQSYAAFAGGPAGFDAVLGARGSQLQLVLNTVFHLETSPGNIPWSLYESIKSDPRVKIAIPYATGDNYLGFRIVGTTPEIFTDFQYQEGKTFAVEEGGRFFDPNFAEAVIGSFVAQETGLKVGDTFKPYHGLDYNPESQHDNVYTVVGILQPTNSPSDRVVWIPIEGVFRMGGHVLRGTGQVYTAQPGQTIPDEDKEVSAVMLKLRTPTAGLQLDQTINKQGKVATLAFPIGRVMADLFDKIGWINRVFEVVSYLVVLVSAAAILASIYNTINERRREFAILRALGARERIVFAAIVAESAAIAGLGALLGFAVYAAIIAAAAVAVRSATGVVLDAFLFHPALVLTPIGMVLIGAGAGLVPAFKAYATDVAENIVPHS